MGHDGTRTARTVEPGRVPYRRTGCPNDRAASNGGPDSPGVRGRTSCFRRTASPPAASGPTAVLTIHFGHRSEGWKGTPR